MLITSYPSGRKALILMLSFFCSFQLMLGQIVIRDSSDPNVDGVYWNFGTANGRNFYQKFNGSATISDYALEWSGTKWILKELTTLDVFYSNAIDSPEPPCAGWQVTRTGYTSILMTGTPCTKVIQVAGSDIASLNGTFQASGTANGRESFVNAAGAQILWVPSAVSADGWEFQLSGTTYYKNTVDIVLPACANIGTWNPLLGNDPIVLKGDCAQYLPNQIQVSGNGSQVYYGVYERILTGTVGGKTVYEQPGSLFFGINTIYWESSTAEWRISIAPPGYYHASSANDPEPPCQGWTDYTNLGTTYTINLTGNCYIAAAAPVTWGEFTLREGISGIRLSWQTLAEENNRGFYIQRAWSKQGERVFAESLDWQDLAFVSGAGTSQEPLVYHYTDPMKLVGSYVYRIKQQDYNGTYSFSQLQEIHLVGGDVLGIYPNPAQANLFLNSAQIPQSVAILNMEGKVIRTPQRNTAHVDISTLPGGIYVLQVSLKDRVVYARFSKTH